MFNKFDNKEDSYYLKYVYKPNLKTYGYVEKSPLTNNYQYYESEIDKHTELDFTKGKNFNDNVVNDWYHTYPLISDKLRTE
jgi:hypothetical protein